MFVPSSEKKPQGSKLELCVFRCVPVERGGYCSTKSQGVGKRHGERLLWHIVPTRVLCA